MGSFYFMKNEKMIILIQVLERGNNYTVVSIKGSELQETTICHAQENEKVNEVTTNWFEKRQPNPEFLLSIAPVR